MATSRRSFLYASASGAAVSQSLAFQADPPPAPLSQSVLSATEASIKQLRTEAHGRHMTARSIRRAHTSLGIFFDHLDETGHTAHMQRLLKEKGLLDNPLDYQQLTLVRERYTAKTGEAMSDTQFQLLVQNNATMWPKFHALMEHGGVKAVRAQILAGLENGADRIEHDEKSGLAKLDRGASGAHLVKAQEIIGQNCGSYGCSTQQDGGYGWDICAGISLLGVYVGTWGVMDALAVVSVFAIGPVGWSAIGLFLATAAFMCM